MKKFCKENMINLIGAGFCLLFGILFLSIRENFLDVFKNIFAWIIIIISIIKIVICGTEKFVNKIELTDGFITLIIGIVILAIKARIILIVMGIVILLINVLGLVINKRFNEQLKNDKVNYIVGGTLLVYGIFYTKVNEVICIILAIGFFISAVSILTYLYLLYKKKPIKGNEENIIDYKE